jgi:hypothetical protein
VNPTEVHWVQGTGSPNASTVGRNTLRTAGTNNFDLNVTKSIPFGESRHLELRWEALNALNHPQFVNVPQMSVNGTGRALPQSRFHRQRHPQHAGSGETGVLKRFLARTEHASEIGLRHLSIIS